MAQKQCKFRAGAECGRFLTRLRARELTEERLRLCRPSASHFTGKNDQTSSSMCSRELWINSFFPLASLTQRSAVLPCATTVGSPVPSERRHQRGIHGNLCSMEEWKTVRDDLQPSSVRSRGPSPARWWRREHRLPSTTERRHFPERSLDDPTPCLRASCSVVATGVKWTATPGETRGGEARRGGGEAKGAEEGALGRGKNPSWKGGK